MTGSPANTITIKPVSSRSELREFLQFPWKIYANDPLWVPPLIPERKKVLDPRRGSFFKRGTAECFLAVQKRKTVGTICLGEDYVTNQQRGRNDCLVGFFEYVQDPAVFHAMVCHAREWAAARRLDALYGPFNLDYEDGYGVLIEGRDRPPVILCGHTPAYYQGFMEENGFVPARGDNLAYVFDLHIESEQIQRLALSAERLRAAKRFSVRPADFTQWDREVEGVWCLINLALAHLPDFIPWQRAAMEELFESFRKTADPDLILFAEFEGEIVGFFPGVPNWNEILIHANGLRYPWDMLRLAWQMRNKPNCLSVKSVLVHPDFWGSGVALLLFDEMIRRAKSKGYQWADLSLTSDDNPKTPMLAERLGAQVYKRYRVYRLPLESKVISV